MKRISVLTTVFILLLIAGCAEEITVQSIPDQSITKPGAPPAVQSLNLLFNDKQIAGSGKSIQVWTKTGASYQLTWTKTAEGTFPFAAIADIDNDNSDELVACYTGVRKTAGQIFIQIYENGSTGTPSITSENLALIGHQGINYMTVKDANNDGTMEIIIASARYISVHQVTGNSITLLWKSEYLYSDYPFGVDAGDADNDGSVDIVYAALFSERFGVYKYLGNNTWGDKIYSPVFGGQDRVFVADTDGDGLNEVVTGGNYQKALVYKYNGSGYEKVFESELLGGFTQGITAGDFDGDGKIEIAAGAVAGGTNTLYIFKYLNGSYSQVFSKNLVTGMGNIASGDLDNDGKEEIVTGSSTMEIFKWNGTSYSKVFSGAGSGMVSIN